MSPEITRLGSGIPVDDTSTAEPDTVRVKKSPGILQVSQGSRTDPSKGHEAEPDLEGLRKIYSTFHREYIGLENREKLRLQSGRGDDEELRRFRDLQAAAKYYVELSRKGLTGSRLNSMFTEEDRQLLEAVTKMQEYVKTSSSKEKPRRKGPRWKRVRARKPK